MSHPARVACALITLLFGCAPAPEVDQAPPKKPPAADGGQEPAPDAGAPNKDASVTPKNPNCAEGVFEGDLAIQAQPDIALIKGCTRVTGTITVSAEKLADLQGLESLRTIDGALAVAPTLEMARVVAMGRLPTTTSPSALTSFAGLEELRSVRSLLLFGLSELTDLAALSKLEKINQTLAVRQCDGLHDLKGLSGLTQLSELLVGANAQLDALLGSSLKEFPTSIVLEDNHQLRSLSGIVGGAGEVEMLSLNHLTELQQLGELNGLKSGAKVEILGCPKLQSLSGLGSLQSAGTLKINDNDTLHDLGGLEGLTTVSGSLSVLHNAWLVSLRALSGLKSAGSAMAIDGNAQLPKCEVAWLAGRLNLAVPSGNNGPDGTCP